MKLCKNCRYYSKNQSFLTRIFGWIMFDKCVHPNIKKDMVTGKCSLDSNCYYQRNSVLDTACGEDGKWYE